MFKIGSNVSVVNEPVDGVVTAIHGNHVTIETADGFLYTYLKKELVIKPSSEIERLLHKSIDWNKNSVNNKPKKSKTKSEVDLHYNGKFILPKDVLRFQLQQFKFELNLAIKANQPKITFIHGMGAGILRTEIEKILAKNNISFSEGSFVKYGEFGAIVVYLSGIKEIIH